MPRKGYSSVTLPSSLVREAQKMLKSPAGEKYRSLTELASDALEDKLGALRGAPIVSIRNVSREDAKRLILEYLQQNPGSHYPSDIAYALGLDLELAFEVTESLLREHVIETVAKKEVEARFQF